MNILVMEIIGGTLIPLQEKNFKDKILIPSDRQHRRAANIYISVYATLYLMQSENATSFSLECYILRLH